MNAGGFEFPYEEIPEDARELASAPFAGLEGFDQADHVTVRAAALSGAFEGRKVHLPALIFEFASSTAPGGPGEPTHKVALVIDTPERARALGKILRDAAYGAANAVERGGVLE